MDYENNKIVHSFCLVGTCEPLNTLKLSVFALLNYQPPLYRKPRNKLDSITQHTIG